MPGLKDTPGDHIIRFRFAAAMATAGTDDEVVAFEAPYNMTITSVDWVPDAAVTADGTDYTTVSLRNRGAADAGAAVPASRSYAATNSVARRKEAMTLSGTAADLNLTAGDVVTARRIHSGAGVAVPAGLIEVHAKVR